LLTQTTGDLFSIVLGQGPDSVALLRLFPFLRGSLFERLLFSLSWQQKNSRMTSKRREYHDDCRAKKAAIFFVSRGVPDCLSLSSSTTHPMQRCLILAEAGRRCPPIQWFFPVPPPASSIFAMGFVFCLLLPLLLPPSCCPPDPPVPALRLSLSSTNCSFSRVCRCRQPTPGGKIRCRGMENWPLTMLHSA
jgi:hypothetical protein